MHNLLSSWLGNMTLIYLSLLLSGIQFKRPALSSFKCVRIRIIHSTIRSKAYINLQTVISLEFQRASPTGRDQNASGRYWIGLPPIIVTTGWRSSEWWKNILLLNKSTVVSSPLSENIPLSLFNTVSIPWLADSSAAAISVVVLWPLRLIF